MNKPQPKKRITPTLLIVLVISSAILFCIICFIILSFINQTDTNNSIDNYQGAEKTAAEKALKLSENAGPSIIPVHFRVVGVNKTDKNGVCNDSFGATVASPSTLPVNRYGVSIEELGLLGWGSPVTIHICEF